MLERWVGATSWEAAGIIAYLWVLATSNGSPVVLHVSLRCGKAEHAKFLLRPPNRLI
jgi:hypothetical protein